MKHVLLYTSGQSEWQHKRSTFHISRFLVHAQYCGITYDKVFFTCNKQWVNTVTSMYHIHMKLWCLILFVFCVSYNSIAHMQSGVCLYGNHLNVYAERAETVRLLQFYRLLPQHQQDRQSCLKFKPILTTCPRLSKLMPIQEKRVFLPHAKTTITTNYWSSL